MYGYVYKTTNLLNGKIYIGQHKASIFEPDKYIGSGTILLEAINKYGKENFKCELLCECLTQSELDEKEIYYIDKFNSTNKDIGYNIALGGNSGVTTKDYVWINNGCAQKSVSQTDLINYLNAGWIEGRLTVMPCGWNKGLSKETNQSLKQLSDIRKEKIANGEIKCCFGLKGKASPNYIQDEDLLLYIDKNEFINYWFENGRCKTAKKYHMRTELVDRVLNLYNIKETKEHKSYIYRKARANRNNKST